MSQEEDLTHHPQEAFPFSKDQLLSLSLQISGIGTWQLHPQSQTVSWDDRCKELYGFAPEDEVPYEEVLRYLHPEDREAVDKAVMAAVAGENKGRYEIQFRTVGARDGKIRWLLCKGQAFFNAGKEPMLFAGTAQEVSGIVRMQQQASRSEKLAQDAIASAGAGTYNYNLITGLFLYSPLAKQIFTGSLEGPFSREDFIAHIYPADTPIRDQAHKKALETGVLQYECRVVWDDQTIHWVRINGAYETGENGAPILYTGIITDITEQKTAQIALQKSEQLARHVVQDSPVAKFITVGDNAVLEMVNKEMQLLLGADAELTGQSLLQAIPAFEGTSVPEILAQVRRDGIRIEVGEEMFKSLNPSGPEIQHYYHKHSPLRDEKGNIYGVMSSWIELTKEVVLRNQAAGSQALLEAAIETAQLGTFEVDLLRNKIELSPRIKEWMGFAPDRILTPAEAFATLTDDRPLREAIEATFQQQGREMMDVEYQITHPHTGITRFVRSRGKIFKDERRGAILIGTIQDITAQRNHALALEFQVQLRTEELAAAVEEMQATNEELAASNTQLTHSNEELAQYAYVASHDLQEPLRKIQVFSGMLAQKQELDGKSQELVSKIGQSATRMALLIRDLLDFSRLLKSDNIFQPVDLNVTVGAVLSDFELIRKEKGAFVQVEQLPRIEAVGLQMNQLFYNLIGNALKFTRPGVTPQITITAAPVPAEEAAEYVPHLFSFTRYYRICIRDNGIGFEAEYAEQIFEVFKRLHARDAFPGAGIGLALCRRIMANHNGALYTEATPGQGATFCLIMPERQNG